MVGGWGGLLHLHVAHSEFQEWSGDSREIIPSRDT